MRTVLHATGRLFVILMLMIGTARAQAPVRTGCTPPPKGLIAWWPFDETAIGTVADRIGLAPGRHVNGPKPVPGRWGGALQFDGRASVEIPGFHLDVDRTDFSIALWLQTRDASRGVKVLVDKRTLTPAVQGYSLWLADGRVGLQMADGKGFTNYRSDVLIADGAWHFIVVSVQRQSQRGGLFYVDGRVAGTFDPTVRTGSLHNGGALRVGSRFKGRIDELQLIRRALSASDIAPLVRGPQCTDVMPTLAMTYDDLRPQYANGVVIVKLSSFPSSNAVRDLDRRFGAGRFVPLFPSVRRNAPGGLDRFYRVSIDPRVDALTAALAYTKAPGVESAEPNLILHADTSDPYYNPTDLWNLYKVNAANAWATATGAGVVVAVVDSGVDITHPDLAANIWTNVKEGPGDQNNDGCPGLCGVDDDGDGNIDEGVPQDDDENGYADDFQGWDFVDGDNTTQDLSGHGTHVAGTIGAIANNNLGIVGLAYGAKIMPLRGIMQQSGLLTDLAAGVEYAATNGAGVINDSWSGIGRSPLLESVMTYARWKNAVVVNAAGNGFQNVCFFTPANVESAMTVASTDMNDAHSTFSNASVKLDVAAPGEGILSTQPGNLYQTLNGTSMAAPHVSALAALLREVHPGWTPEEIRQVIRMTATDVGAAGFDALTGYGRIDAGAALQMTTPRPYASLEDPYNGARVSGTINLNGWAGGAAFNGYELSIGYGIAPASFTIIGIGLTVVNGGVLAAFNTTTKPDGLYTLRLVSKTPNANVYGEDRNAIIIDNSVKSGWPVDMSDGWMKSPRVADLDGDGTKEIIVGASVLDRNGIVRTGWDPNPGRGRTNPAIYDVDGDGIREVIAAVWSCDLACNSTEPNDGAPVLYAYEPDKTVQWSFTVVNPNSIPGYYHGVPSSVSVGDVDGDGMAEVVFTVDFNYNNSPYDTRVFVLDAKTGVQESAFQIPGRSMSSVGLLPSGSGALLVISSDSGVYVVDHNGNAASGWPQTPGNGDIDPVIADVDLDNVPEIVIGNVLWGLNGTPKPGWPLGNYMTRGAGGVGQLNKQDCELEVIVGSASNLDLWSVVEHNAASIYWTFIQGENMVVIMLGENGAPGNITVADVDGDGEPEITKPPDFGFTNGDAARVYGYQATTATPAQHFPMYFWEPQYILRSTPTYDDVDNDGLTDMLMMTGTNTLYVWSLGTPFNANNPWPMFQHDLATTGYFPRPQPAGADLWVEDTPYFYSGSYPDTGDEPAASMASEPMWTSRAIWVRNNLNDPGPHQNPEAGQVNEIYIEVKNRGCTTSAAGTVEAYFANASVGLVWPSDWTLIGTASVPALAPGQTVQVTVPWTPLVQGHFCLLARITSEPMTTAETPNIDFNVRRNNNLAWRNVNVVDLQLMVQDDVQVIVANVKDVRTPIDLTFRAHEPFLAEGGALTVNLGRLFGPWQKAGARGRNITVLNGTRIAIRALPATIEGIPMTGRQKERITLRVQAMEPLQRKGTSNRYAVDVVESIERKEIGGVSYSIIARGLDADTDKDGIPDTRDPDDDNDGIPDGKDPNPLGKGPARAKAGPHIL